MCLIMKHHKSTNPWTHVYIIIEFSSVVWLARHITTHTHRTQGTQTHNRININMHAPGMHPTIRQGYYLSLIHIYINKLITYSQTVSIKYWTVLTSQNPKKGVKSLRTLITEIN